ncbi:MAG: 2-amino-4-hydroxy-6-hydroxymethyldihydropteridine diphosphokinase [Pseudomonadota bacterium]
MNLIEININKYLLLEKFIFNNPMNNIDELATRSSENLNKRLDLLTLAANKIEKFHSYFHFEQSYFHLQLAIKYLQNNESEKAKEQLELSIFQDHTNNQAIQMLKGSEDYLPYERPFKTFSAYIRFATEEDNICSYKNTFWEDWKHNNDIASIIDIIEKIKFHHLNYYQESAKLYLNRAIIFHNLKNYELAKNDLVKANNLDNKLKEKACYLLAISQIGTEVVLGLGSNLGDREAFLKRAIKELHNLEILIDIKLSSIEETDAILKPDSPKEWNLSYLNMAIKGYCLLPPQSLLKKIKDIEQSLGRQNYQTWAPREIDIDILAYGNEIIQEDNLTIPHSFLLERPWIIKHFSELLPLWQHPIVGPNFMRYIKDIYEKK